jgi:hypothetical protein
VYGPPGGRVEDGGDETAVHDSAPVAVLGSGISFHHALDLVDADVAKTQKRGKGSRHRTIGVRVAGSVPGLGHGLRLSRCCPLPRAPLLLRDGLAGERFKELRGHPVNRDRVTLEDGMRDLAH